MLKSFLGRLGFPNSEGLMKLCPSVKSRRIFLAALLSFYTSFGLGACNRKKRSASTRSKDDGKVSEIFRSVNGNPAQNMAKVLELAGGIEKLIDSEDIVIIKPNLQWWNQGAPNIAACEKLIDCIMNRKGGFSGEVIIGENTHRGKSPWKTTGWAYKFSFNADLAGVDNYNGLCALLKKRYGRRFSVCHWIDVSSGGKRVYNPQDGVGYVYCDGTNGVPLISMDNACEGELRRKVIMSYPIFITDNNTIVDFKNGIWKNGSYTGQPTKFINLAALNHHSTYCGMTSGIKNYFGIADLSNGADPENGGKLIGDYYNFHAFAFNEWSKGPAPGIMGAEIGMFIKTIRRAELNIITAEWIGLSSRTDLPVAHTQIIMAGTDPVALDYHASKYVLFPNSRCPHHDPEWLKGPLFSYLSSCASHIGCMYDESRVEVHSYDHHERRIQLTAELPVLGKITWGKDLESVGKYLLFRFGSSFLS